MIKISKSVFRESILVGKVRSFSDGLYNRDRSGKFAFSSAEAAFSRENNNNVQICDTYAIVHVLLHALRNAAPINSISVISY